MKLNPNHRGATIQLKCQRRGGITHQLDSMITGDMTSPAGHIAVRRATQPPRNSNLAEVGLGGVGYVSYPGRVVRVLHPSGVVVEALAAGDVHFSANPIVSLNPAISDSKMEGVA